MGEDVIFSQFSSVAQSYPTLFNPMDCSMPGLPVHHQLPKVYSNSCPLSQWCHPTISSSIVPLSSCLQPFPALGSFPISQFFAFGGQSILGLCQILSKPAFICHFCPTLPRTLMLPPVTVTRGKVVVVWPLWGHNSKKSTCVGEKPFPWELIALQSILWPTRIDCRNTGFFFNSSIKILPH